MRLFLIAVLASGHTYHSSIAQLDYISSKKTIEAIVWLHTEDIEQAFKAQQGSAANFDQPLAAERFVSQYLKSHFELRDKQGHLLDQKWVGLELKVHFLVAYFELSADALTLTNTLLLDRVPDQLNTVQLKQDGQARQELHYSRAKPSPQTLPAQWGGPPARPR